MRDLTEVGAYILRRLEEREKLAISREEMAAMEHGLNLSDPRHQTEFNRRWDIHVQANPNRYGIHAPTDRAWDGQLRHYMNEGTPWRDRFRSLGNTLMGRRDATAEDIRNLQRRFGGGTERTQEIARGRAAMKTPPPIPAAAFGKDLRMLPPVTPITAYGVPELGPVGVHKVTDDQIVSQRRTPPPPPAAARPILLTNVIRQRGGGGGGAPPAAAVSGGPLSRLRQLVTAGRRR